MISSVICCEVFKCGVLTCQEELQWNLQLSYKAGLYVYKCSILCCQQFKNFSCKHLETVGRFINERGKSQSSQNYNYDNSQPSAVKFTRLLL